MKTLESRLDAWRRTMARAAGHRPELLAELEAHLCEEIQRLIDAGATEEKAFDEAVSKLGAPAELAGEYDKIAPVHRGWLPVKIAWIIGLVVAVAMGVFLIPKLGQGRITVLLMVHVWCVTLGYLAMFMMGGLGICYLCAQWFSEGATVHRDALAGSIARFAATALVLTSIGIVLGAIWARENMGRYWAWDPKETAASLVFAWAAVMTAARWAKPSRRSAVIIMSLMGNVITAWAWFGANALAAESSPPAVLYIFIAAHVALILASLFPNLRRRQA